LYLIRPAHTTSRRPFREEKLGSIFIPRDSVIIVIALMVQQHFAPHR
jgi:hypothetical protein